MSLTREYIVSAHGAQEVGAAKASTPAQAFREFIGRSNDPVVPINRPTKPMEQSVWVYACVMEIIRTCQSIEMILSDSNENIVESGPVYDWMYNNPNFTWNQFLSNTIGNITLFNNCFWLFSAADRNQCRVAAPQEMKANVINGALVSWEYTKNKHREILLPQEVYLIKGYNPDSDYFGVYPVKVGELVISTAIQAEALNEATLANGGRIGNVIVYPGRLDPEEKEYLSSRHDARHAGAANAGRTLILSGGADIKSYAQSMADLQMIDLRQFDANEICAIFKVPPELVGLATEAQYAHGPAQQRFVANTIAGLLDDLAHHINQGIIYRRLLRDINANTLALTTKNLKKQRCYRQAKIKAGASKQNKLFAWFAVDEHPAIHEMKREIADKMLKNVTSGVPLNQIIDAYDLPFDTTEITWGNDWWVSSGLAPARMVMETGLLENQPEPTLSEGVSSGEEQPVEDESAKPDEEKKPKKTIVHHEGHEPAAPEAYSGFEGNINTKGVWEKWVKSWAPLERAYLKSIRLYWIKQQETLIKRLRAELGQKTKADGDIAKIIGRIVFGLASDNQKLALINRGYFDQAAGLGIRQILTETLGLSGQALEEAAARVANTKFVAARSVASTSRLTGVNRVTQELVKRQLNAGLEAGESVEQLTERVQNTLGANRARALTIARTQTAGAIQTGRQAGMTGAGVKGKKWITAGDDGVRPEHKAAGRDYASAIPVDQPFRVGGEALDYPGDPKGSAGNIINCRCLHIAARLANGKAIGPPQEFYSYHQMMAEKPIGLIRPIGPIGESHE